ncbi:MAG: hypothetical protein GXP54_12400 [Deltaproteobacteria bacterium]|nr:hypothetical protein [Deltaproteobacteria bacterium]
MQKTLLVTTIALLSAYMACGTGNGGAPDIPGDSGGQDTGIVEDATKDTTDGLEAVEDALPTTPGGLPLSLPFVLTRPDPGEPLPDAEIADFTARMTGLWKQIDFFTWVYETTHGTDASTGMPDYLIWWHDVVAVKEGDKVTFRNSAKDGGSHNNAEPTMLVLAQAIGGYLLTGDPAMGRVVEQFTKSITAVMKGFVYDENDPIQHLMARNIITINQEFVLPSGKKKAVDYSEWYFSYEGWNADRFEYKHNPVWGDVWVTNKRSKDDVPYFYRVAAWLPYLIELTDDETIRGAAQEALDLLEQFARDIVDHGWQIRTKDKDGNAVFVEGQDLDDFVTYTDLIPDAECDPRLATALLGYDDPLDQDCGNGQGSLYDTVAEAGHYFNHDIIDQFHMAALALALTRGKTDVAKELLKGLIIRIERYRNPSADEPGQEDENWEKDIARLLLMAASLGYPLNNDEARQIQKVYLRTVEAYEDFPRWDLWDKSVPDGEYSFRDGGMYPKHQPQYIRIEDIAFVLEYCWSPFKNPAGIQFVDCELVKDPKHWGG